MGFKSKEEKDKVERLVKLKKSLYQAKGILPEYWHLEALKEVRFLVAGNKKRRL